MFISIMIVPYSHPKLLPPAQLVHLHLGDKIELLRRRPLVPLLLRHGLVQRRPGQHRVLQLEPLLKLLLLPQLLVVGELVRAVEAPHHATGVQVVVVGLLDRGGQLGEGGHVHGVVEQPRKVLAASILFLGEGQGSLFWGDKNPFCIRNFFV